MWRAIIIIIGIIILGITLVVKVVCTESYLLKKINMILKSNHIEDYSKLINSIIQILDFSEENPDTFKYDVTGNGDFLKDVNRLLKDKQPAELRDAMAELIKKYET